MRDAVYFAAAPASLAWSAPSSFMYCSTICGTSSLVTFIYQSPSGQIIIFGPKAQTSKQPDRTTRILPFRLRSLVTLRSASTISSEPL